MDCSAQKKETMIELIELIDYLKNKHGIVVRFCIGVSEDGSFIMYGIADLTTTGKRNYPSESVGFFKIPYDDMLSFDASLRAAISCAKQYYDDLIAGDEDVKIIEGSISEWGFCDRSFINNGAHIDGFNSIFGSAGKKWP